MAHIASRFARRALLALLGAVLLLAHIGPPPTAAAHARVVGSHPADGAVLDAPPERVTLLLDAKPATEAGDPLRVYAPTGERVDRGGPTVSTGGRALAVEIHPGRELTAGRYHLAYRVVSEDEHLIAGRIEFRVRRPMRGGGEVPVAATPTHDDSESGWPIGLAARGLVLTGSVATVRLWPRRTARHAAWRAP